MAMTGFWAGFGQGFQAEMDRAERRKMFMDEQKERRTQTFLQLALSRGQGAGGGSGGGEGSESGKVDVDAYTTALVEMGADSEKIAQIVAEDPSGQALAKIYDEYNGLSPDIPRSAELLSKMVDGTVVGVQMGEPIDFESIYAAAGVELSPEELQLAEIAGRPGPAKVTTLTTVTPQKPLSPSEQNAAAKPFQDVLANELKRQELALRSTNPDQAMLFEQASNDLAEGVVTTGLQLVGTEIFQPMFEQNPELLNANLGLFNEVKPNANQEQAPVATPEAAPAGTPVGTIRVGRGGVKYRFLGGDESDKANWEQVE
jgi:hypothetical protein